MRSGSSEERASVDEEGSSRIEKPGSSHEAAASWLETPPSANGLGDSKHEPGASTTEAPTSRTSSIASGAEVSITTVETAIWSRFVLGRNDMRIRAIVLGVVLAVVGPTATADEPQAARDEDDASIKLVMTTLVSELPWAPSNPLPFAMAIDFDPACFKLEIKGEVERARGAQTVMVGALTDQLKGRGGLAEGASNKDRAYFQADVTPLRSGSHRWVVKVRLTTTGETVAAKCLSAIARESAAARTLYWNCDLGPPLHGPDLPLGIERGDRIGEYVVYIHKGPEGGKVEPLTLVLVKDDRGSSFVSKEPITFRLYRLLGSYSLTKGESGVVNGDQVTDADLQDQRPVRGLCCYMMKDFCDKVEFGPEKRKLSVPTASTLLKAIGKQTPGRLDGTHNLNIWTSGSERGKEGQEYLSSSKEPLFYSNYPPSTRMANYTFHVVIDN